MRHWFSFRLNSRTPRLCRRHCRGHFFPAPPGVVPQRRQLAQPLWHQLDRDGGRNDHGGRGPQRPGVRWSKPCFRGAGVKWELLVLPSSPHLFPAAHGWLGRGIPAPPHSPSLCPRAPACLGLPPPPPRSTPRAGAQIWGRDTHPGDWKSLVEKYLGESDHQGRTKLIFPAF